MGVKDLWTILDKAGNEVKLEALNGKRVAIDASIWAHQFLKALKDGQGNILHNAHILGFLRRICKLLFYNIKPVFVFDGPAPAIKRRTLNNRRAQREHAEEKLQVTAEKLLLSHLKAAAARSSAENSLSDLSADSVTKGPDPQQVQEVLASYYSNPNSRKRDRDTFELPNLENGVLSNVTADDPRYDFNEELLQYLKEFKPDMEEISLDAFDDLPILTRYEIINELRGRSRQTSTKRLQHMVNHAPKAIDFSQLQIQNLMQRNQLTQKYLDVVGIGEERNLPTTARIATAKNRAFSLVKNTDSGGGWKLATDGTVSSLPTRSSGLLHSPTEVIMPKESVELIEEADTTYYSDPELEDTSLVSEKDSSGSLLNLSGGTTDEGNPLPTTTQPPPTSDLGGPSNVILLDDSDEEDDFEEVPIQPSPESKVLPVPVTQLDSESKSESDDEDDSDVDPRLKYESLEELLGFDSLLKDNIDKEVPMAQTFLKLAMYKWTAKKLLSKWKFYAKKQTGWDDPHFDDYIIYEEFCRDILGYRFPKVWAAEKAREKKPESKPEKEVNQPKFDDDDDDALKAWFQAEMAQLAEEERNCPLTKMGAAEPIFQPKRTPPTQPSAPKKPQGTYTIGHHADHTGPKPKIGLTTIPPGVSQPTQQPAYPTHPLTSAPVSGGHQPPSVSVQSSLATGSYPNHSNVALDPIDSHPRTKPNTYGGHPQSPNVQPQVPTRPNAPEVPPSQPNVIPNPSEPQSNNLPVTPSVPHLTSTGNPPQSHYTPAQLSGPTRHSGRSHRPVSQSASLLANKSTTSSDPSTSQFDDIKELLTLFGIPYVNALGEAEAQCAKLTELGLVDGIVTDDSDVFLFGGTPVYRHLFHQGKSVCCYTLDNLRQSMHLTRSRLIELAHLLGSDYTVGITGVGPVAALEILSCFPTGLAGFYTWWQELTRSQTKTSVPQSTPLRKKLSTLAKRLYLPQGFPDAHVTKAYMKPLVDDSSQPFQWGKTDLPGLQRFLHRQLDWDDQKVTEVIQPIILHQERLDKSRQTKVSDYFRPKPSAQLHAEIKSKRLLKALANLPAPASGASHLPPVNLSDLGLREEDFEFDDEEDE